MTELKMNTEEELLKKKFELLIEETSISGYAICDDFITKDEVNQLSLRLASRYTAGEFKKAKIGKLSDVLEVDSVRGDEILWLETDSEDLAERVVLDRNLSFIKYLNETCYMGIVNSEMHFAKYDIGKFYLRHRDTFQSQSGRVMSIIYYLNDAWVPEDGGNLIIYLKEGEVETPITISPIAGRLVCFRSDMLDHEVLPSFKERLSVTGWFLNKN